MVFSSLTFLCAFLPLVFLITRCTKSLKVQNVMLVVASLLFYAYGEPVYILLMIASIILNWIFGLLLNRDSHRKLWMALGVAVNIAMLVVFKYSDFLIAEVNQLFKTSFAQPNIPLPIGISFFTFQALSYVIDVYRRDTPAQRSLLDMTLYISFFPQLIAGPIVKYHEIDKQINDRTMTLEKTAMGIRRFTVGLGKKVLIANTLAAGVDALMAANPANLNILSVWTIGIGYSLQIYYDFSGYSDMAIGMGQMFGFHFQENFNYPFISCSIQELWTRWHISLSTWFKEYLYFPLGGNRKGKVRTTVNKWIVFLCTGLWHGANLTYLLWGAWNGLFVMLEEWIPVKRLPKPLGWMLTALIWIPGILMFRAETVSQGFHLIALLFTGFEFSALATSLIRIVWNPLFLVTMIAGVVGASPWPAQTFKLEKVSYPLSLALYLVCFLSLAGGGYNPFIYFRF